MESETRNHKSVTLMQHFVSTKEMIDKARNGSFDHLASLASMTCDEYSIPENLHKSIFDMAVDYIAKPLPSERDFSRQALRLAKFVCHSFQVVRNLPSKALENSSTAERFLQLWPHGFTWAKYLRLAVTHIHKYHLDEDGEESSREFAAGISAFLDVSSKCAQTREKYILDERVLNFAVEFWAAKNVIQDVAREAANAMNAFLVLHKNEEIGLVLTAVGSHFNSPSEVATLAKARARDALCDMDFEAMASHYGVLSLLTRGPGSHPIRKAVLSEDFVTLILDSMSILLDASYRAFVDRYYPLVLCIGMLSSILSRSDAGNSYVPQGFQHGLVETYFKIGQIYDTVEDDDQLNVSNLLTLGLPAFTHLKSVLQTARQDMARFSKSLDHEPFQTSTLKGGFRNVWQNFEILLLEHSILRRIHAMGIRRDHVYCSNASCDTKGPPRIFMRCAGCKHALYCSQMCQKTSWEAYHSLECKKIRKDETHRSMIPRCDKNYLLFWALVQIRRHLPSIRRAAAARFPGTPFEKIALYADMVVWPMTVLMHPLEHGLHEDEAPWQDRPDAMHYRRLALRRVERGDNNATMVAIHYEDGHERSTKFFVVCLDKSSSKPKREKKGWKSKRPCAVDAGLVPFEAVPDEVDDIVGIVQKTTARLRLTMWIPGLIEGCIDDYFKKM